MISAITSAPGATYFPSGASSVGLQGQLAKYEKELAACVNCASVNTPEGKAKITEVTNRISQIKERIAQASEATPQSPPSSEPRPLSAGESHLGSIIDIKA